jgi:adenosylmethionine-8-amino-7-oxononanoate aminotransferase
LKQAFQYWQQRSDPRPQKTKYIAFEDAYHGDTIGSVSVGGVARFHEMFRPLLFDVLRSPIPSTYRLPAGVTANDSCQYFLNGFEKVLAEHHEDVAAVVIEPLIQCAAGMITHPGGFLRGVRNLTLKYDVLLIVDEIATGFGRTGTMFACEQEGVNPDFLCLGKGLTGGYLPMSATLSTDEIWNAFLGDYAESKAFFHGHTFGGNPLAAAAGLATLDIFEEEQTLVLLESKIARLRRHLLEIAEHPKVGDVRQRGMIAGIELVRDKSTQEPFAWEERVGGRVCQSALSDGVWLRPLGNVVVIMPPLSISDGELDQICRAVGRAINVVLQK